MLKMQGICRCYIDVKPPAVVGRHTTKMQKKFLPSHIVPANLTRVMTTLYNAGIGS